MEWWFSQGSDLTQQHNKLCQPQFCVFEGDSHSSCLRWVRTDSTEDRTTHMGVLSLHPGGPLQKQRSGESHDIFWTNLSFALVGTMFILIFWGSLVT